MGREGARRLVTKPSSMTLEDMIGQYGRLVYTVCYQLTQDAQTAEDLTQETFLSAYLHRSSCPEAFEKPWLAKIAANKAKDYLQSAYRRHTVLPGENGLPDGSPQPSSEDLLLQKTGAQRIRKLVEQLREPYRSVCRLNLLEEKTPEEIARQLGRPVKTIHTQVARGKEMLRRQIERGETP